MVSALWFKVGGLWFKVCGSGFADQPTHAEQACEAWGFIHGMAFGPPAPIRDYYPCPLHDSSCCRYNIMTHAAGTMYMNHAAGTAYMTHAAGTTYKTAIAPLAPPCCMTHAAGTTCTTKVSCSQAASQRGTTCTSGGSMTCRCRCVCWVACYAAADAVACMYVDMQYHGLWGFSVLKH